MKTRTFIMGVSAAATAFAMASASADIIGSAHDFSPYGWSDGEICKPCHTPHDADTTVVRAPLWNHELTTATYTLYDGSAGDTSDLDGRSVLCMSCHDGTVALDSFGGNTGTQYITGGLIGQDLQDDHPLGSQGIYPDPVPRWFKDPSTFPHGMDLEEMIVDGETVHVVSCTSCHEPHKRGGREHMLWVDQNASGLCLTCHTK